MHFKFNHIKEALTTPLSLDRILLLSLKWVVLSIIIGTIIGSVSAIFLFLLETVTDIRVTHPYLLYGLPLGGLCIGLLYHYYGNEANKGNNLIIDEYHHSSEKTIPLRMFPLVLLGTLTTHLFGGSAGREGTAVQMGGTIADQFTKYLKLSTLNRKTVLLMGVSAGFASVFGTPLAGIFFAFELMLLKNLRLKAILPVAITAYVSHYVCLNWGIKHTIYTVETVPQYNALYFITLLGIGIIFGGAAYLFICSTKLWAELFTTTFSYPPLRPFIGAILFIILIWLMGDDTYLGLGVPIIVESFSQQMGWEVFLLKILFTSLTLGAGFKGGEVTPLFYIGATLGSFLSIYIGLPVSLMAALGFVAVFSGATKTPLACTFMGIELFGIEYAIPLVLVCLTSHFISGRQSVYSSQYKYKTKSNDLNLN